MRIKNMYIPVIALFCLVFLNACAGMKHSPEADAALQTLRQEARASLETLFAATPETKALHKTAVGVLVFPDILKAGLLVGGSGGKGVLFSPDMTVMGYYRVASVSYGLQAGVQDYAQAMFLTTPDALEYLESSKGWSVGVGPSIVVMDEGAAKELSTTTARSDVLAFIYGQKGLMGGIGVQGQKITRLIFE